jgi:suppressor of ftsI
MLVGGAAAAATIAVLTVEGCQLSGGAGGPGIPGNLDSYELTAQYSTHTFAGKTLRTRTYDGQIPGPTIYAAPGQPFNVTINNQLPPNPPAAVPASAIVHPVSSMEDMENPAGTHSIGVLSTSIDPMNNPHLFNTTNLHVHGVQIVPHLFDPVGTSNPSAMMIAINPGTSLTYNFVLPPDHPSGLYWYHPHHHGSTDVEVSGGMAGLIIIGGPIDRVPEIAAAREIPIAVQSLQVNADATQPGIYDTEYIAYQTPQNGGYNPRSQYMFVLSNGQLVTLIDFTTVNFGVSTDYPPPQITMQPGEVVRFRILNGTNELNLPLQLPGFEMYVIGHDGVNLLAPQLIDQTGSGSAFATTAGRIEMLVRAPQTVGTYTLKALAVSDPGVHPWPQFDLMSILVAGAPVSMNIPAALPTPAREYPLIADSEIVGQRNVVFNSSPSTSILPGFALTVNGAVYDEMTIMFDLVVGTAEQWVISNDMPEGHPFHLHTNSFEAHSVTTPSGTTNYTPPIICDTFWIPAHGSLTMRVRYKEWKGKDVFHCHKLSHEDQGMMANTMLV